LIRGHPRAHSECRGHKGVDARHEAGHDEDTKSGSTGTMGISLRTLMVLRDINWRSSYLHA
jgi:hypothetical protein